VALAGAACTMHAGSDTGRVAQEACVRGVRNDEERSMRRLSIHPWLAVLGCLPLLAMARQVDVPAAASVPPPATSAPAVAASAPIPFASPHAANIREASPPDAWGGPRRQPDSAPSDRRHRQPR